MVELTRKPVLHATGLTKTFGGLVAVDRVDLSLTPGESVGVIGPNGAGKSTLLNLLVGTLHADRGTLMLADRDITRDGLHKRVAAGVARAAQIPQTFGRLTVTENIRVPAVYGAGLRAAKASAWTAEVVAMCGLSEVADTKAEQLGLLSRKRLELAKAVAARPKILLLDEVAAGLTEPEIETIMELVRTLRDGRAIMWVEHIPFALRGVCERLIVMDKGSKTLDGPFEDVWADPDLQATYMGVPDDTAA